jgi:hypothetical protein
MDRSLARRRPAARPESLEHNHVLADLLASDAEALRDRSVRRTGLGQSSLVDPSLGDGVGVSLREPLLTAELALVLALDAQGSPAPKTVLGDNVYIPGGGTISGTTMTDLNSVEKSPLQ